MWRSIGYDQDQSNCMENISTGTTDPFRQIYLKTIENGFSINISLDGK